MSASEAQFCCAGCECVHAIIHGLGLEQYYRERAAFPPDTAQASQPSGSSYAYFDDEVFASRYVSETKDGERSIVFYLQGIHCAACVWLLEKLPQIVPDVFEARVQYDTSRLFLRYNASTQLSEIARMIDSLGYPPSPLERTGGKSAAEKQDRRALLMRLGVAGMSAGNTMMLAVSLYQGWFSGIAMRHATFIMWISCLLSLPAITYSALPFYRAAWSGLRSKMLHIDLPISLGILLGFFASVLNTFRGSLHVYYDSICMLIFLLLLGRWLQKSSVDRVRDQNELLYGISERSAKKRNSDGSVEEVYAAALKPGEIVVVAPNEVIPIDGLVQKGSGLLDRSVLTGESRPVPCRTGDMLWAGTRNLTAPLEVIVSESGAHTRLGKMLLELEFSNAAKAPIVELTDRLAGYFVLAVVTTASLCASYWYLNEGFDAALEATLALLVVSCPCALGLAAPISLSVALRSAAKNGIFIKQSATIQRLVEVDCVCLDKTGTLTEGSPQVVRVLERSRCPLETAVSVAAALEQNVIHPVASAILREFDKRQLEPKVFVQSPDYLQGKGVICRDEAGRCWRLGSEKWLRSCGILIDSVEEDFLRESRAGFCSPVLLAQDDQIAAVFAISDSLRPEAKKFVQFLKQRKLATHILSGDHTEIVRGIANTLAIDSSKAHGELEPEAKVSEINKLRAFSNVLMLGDGVNDSGALAAADVGVAICGGVEASLKSADVFFTTPCLNTLKALLLGSEQTVRVIRRNLFFSVLYNVSGAALAVTGQITPLFAAVLMPLSSLTVVVSSLSLRRGCFEENRK